MVGRTVTDEYGLAATVVTAGIDLCDRIVWLVDVTAPRGGGHWSLRYRQGGSTARVPLTVD